MDEYKQDNMHMFCNIKKKKNMARVQSLAHQLGLFTERINPQLYVLCLASYVALVVIQTKASNLPLYGCR